MKKQIESVTLSDGRIVTKRRATVRDFANAENQPQGKEHLSKYAMFAAKIFLDGKIVVMEDVLDLFEDDLLLIAELLEDEPKNV